MSKENVEVVRSIYERWNRNDGDLASELFDPAVEIRQIGTMPDTAGTFHGREGILLAAEELRGAFENIEWVAERWTQKGEWLVVLVLAIGVGGYSGVETEGHLAHAWRVRRGRVADLRVYESEEQALEAIALRD